MGQGGEALSSMREAVELYRDLGEAQTATSDFDDNNIRPVLAAALSSFSHRLLSMGQQEEALSTIREAIDLYSDLGRLDLPLSTRTWHVHLATCPFVFIG